MLSMAGYIPGIHYSFAEYRDSEQVRFGLLREINDDVVQPNMGFDTQLMPAGQGVHREFIAFPW